ncbi:MAG: thiol peroxidase [Candidatus Omnitrophota bacterium]
MLRSITFKGEKMTLMGLGREEGTPAPDFKVIDAELREVTLSQFEGKNKVLTSFPSLDTPVCEMQVKEFNKKAAGLSQEIVILAISKDLPFAQKRFCQAHDIRDIHVLSDYRFSSFGMNYGLLIKELNLLARSILLVDKNNVLRSVQIVGELTHPPDYETALANLEKMLKNPGLPKEQMAGGRHCVPCEQGTPPLDEEKIQNRLADLNGWTAEGNKKLTKIFMGKEFTDIRELVDQIAFLAEDQGHHPALSWHYNKLKITLTTHASGGVTENDLIMARLINELTAS